MKIILLGCTSKKKSCKCAAKDMYSASAFFRYAYEYAKTIDGEIYILSAKYGLLHKYEVIEPYNYTLNNQSESVKKAWSKDVCKQFEKEFSTEKELDIVCLAGQNYRKYLIPLLKTKFQTSIDCPLSNMRIGHQIQHLKKLLNE